MHSQAGPESGPHRTVPAAGDGWGWGRKGIWGTLTPPPRPVHGTPGEFKQGSRPCPLVRGFWAPRGGLGLRLKFHSVSRIGAVGQLCPEGCVRARVCSCACECECVHVCAHVCSCVRVDVRLFFPAPRSFPPQCRPFTCGPSPSFCTTLAHPPSLPSSAAKGPRGCPPWRLPAWGRVHQPAAAQSGGAGLS